MLKSKNLLQFLLPAAYFCLILFFFPFRNVFYFDPDEGINLSKAQLMLQGYNLYEDIWSDQPPVLSHLLTGVMGVFGLKINLARLMILLLACLLIWAVFRILRMVWGDLHAVLGVFLLILLPEFVKLSVSVMVGLPAIVFAAVSLFFLTRWHQQRKTPDLLLSAALLAVSVLTKLFTGFLAPIFLVGLLIDAYARERGSLSWKKLLAPSLIWSLGFGGVLLGLALLLVGPQNFSQLIQVHLISRSLPLFTGDPTLTLAYHLQKALPILLLALAGLVYSLLSRRWLSLYPAAWMIVAGLMLMNHSPVWYHQQLLVTVPAACLAAVACGELFRDLKGLWQRTIRLNARTLFSLACLALLVLTLFTRLPAAFSGFNTRPSLRSPGLKENSRQAQILNKMTRYAEQTRWVITDEPIMTFWAKLPVPPELLVFTNKRLSTGQLTDAQVLGYFQSYRPEQVLLTQYKSPLIDRYLEENYEQTYAQDDVRLYLRRDVMAGQTP